DLGGERLEDLLVDIDRIPGIGRVRLGSLDPTVMTPSFVEKVAALPSLAHHFHLSMQSGCSATLARMRRRYNADMARAAMARVRAAMPDAMLTTDIIVGFPGETEEEFATSLAFAKEAEFLHIHVFPFSPREGTPAATMPGQVPDAIKHARVRDMSKVSEASAARILDGYPSAGAPLAVLPETCGDGYFLGHTANFLEVRVEKQEGDLPTDGDILTVLPIRREGEVLICRPLPTP
ncbi:MAG: radical SAM protein, partial [Clostridia bacterium]|nr:radical SAM protein [Clostridia bacterium]